jgi:hypothetical protein
MPAGKKENIAVGKKKKKSPSRKLDAKTHNAILPKGISSTISEIFSAMLTTLSTQFASGLFCSGSSVFTILNFPAYKVSFFVSYKRFNILHGACQLCFNGTVRLFIPLRGDMPNGSA